MAWPVMVVVEVLLLLVVLSSCPHAARVPAMTNAKANIFNIDVIFTFKFSNILNMGAKNLFKRRTKKRTQSCVFKAD